MRAAIAAIRPRPIRLTLLGYATARSPRIFVAVCADPQGRFCSGNKNAWTEGKVLIREARESDLDDVLLVERSAFAGDDVAELTRDLLEDPSAKPALSLLALRDGRAVGHILFTAARLDQTRNTISASILAPLAVIPEAQKQGIGGRLVERGLQRLSESGVDLVFVRGHPEYYPRHGFRTAGHIGFEAPYPIPDKNADAWMVQALRPNVIGSVRGKVICADGLDRPEHWRE